MWELRRVEGCRGPNNCFLKCPHGGGVIMERICARIMGTRSVHQLYPLKSFIPKGPLKWLALSTSVWNDPSIWRPWLFSLRRAIYPVWNAPWITWSKHTGNLIIINTVLSTNVSQGFFLQKHYFLWAFSTLSLTFSIKGTICKIFVIKHPKTTCTVWYI